MPERCYENNLLQITHKYMDWILVIFIAILGYWFSQLDNRVIKNDERLIEIRVTTQGEKVRQEEIIKILERVDKRIESLEKVLYKLPL